MAQLKSGTRIYGTATIDTTIILNGTSVAVSTNSGALRVVGGVGIGQNIIVGGDAKINGVITATQLKQTATEIYIGPQAGETTFNNQYAIGIGYQAGQLNQATQGVAIGYVAGRTYQGPYGVAIGSGAAANNQNAGGVAVGFGAGYTSQGTSSIAIGYYAGKTVQGRSSIAIGRQAGETNQHDNTIVLNAQELTALDTQNTGSFYVSPIRLNSTGFQLYYNTSTKEISYSAVAGLTSPFSGIFTITNTTAATSTNSGALQVAGGLGVGGSLYVGQTGTFGSNIIIGQGSGGSISGLNTLTVNTLFYQSVGYFTPASTATLTLNVANGMMQKFTLTNASTSITMPSASPGANFMLMLSQDNTGGRLVSSWSSVRWPSGTTATLTTTANKTDIFSFFSDGTSWYGITVAQNF